MAWVWFGLFALTTMLFIGAMVENAELRAALGRPALPKLRIRPQSRQPVTVAESDEIWEHGETGSAARFTYVDADGVVTDRDVRNWRSEGAYINAYCLKARAGRTFRKDRIDEWVSG